jgi:hypothetical protein
VPLPASPVPRGAATRLPDIAKKVYTRNFPKDFPFNPKIVEAELSISPKRAIRVTSLKTGISNPQERV